jgi:hypothetical protein
MEFGRWMAQLQNLSEKRVDFASIRRSQIPICYFRTGIQDVSYRWDKDPCPRARGTQRWKSKLEISHVFSEKKILLCQDSILSFWLRHKLWLSKPFTWYLKYTVLSGRIFPVTMYKRKNNISTSRRRKPERLDFLLCIASCTAGSCHAESYL